MSNSIGTLLILHLFLFLAACASSGTRQMASTPVCDDSQFIYKTCTDQKLLFAEAFQNARTENQLLLVTFGADWCPWCRSLNQIFRNPTFLSKLPAPVQMLEIGMYNGKSQVENPSGSETLGLVIENSKQQPEIQGFPFLALINPANGKVAFLNTGDLEENTATNKSHSPKKLVSALSAAIKLVTKK